MTNYSQCSASKILDSVEHRDNTLRALLVVVLIKQNSAIT